MTEVIQFFKSVEVFIEPFLKNLDPSLFQNIILGMLALLIPVGVGILSFFFQEKSKGNIDANLELFILLKKVLKADSIVIYSFLSLLFLALYNVSNFFRVIGILFFVVYILWLFSIPFKNIWKWFLEDTKDFSISFLEGLNVKNNQNTIVSSWQALWLGGRHKENEEVFTKIFISHIDKAIKIKKYELASQLAKIYVKNISKRDTFLLVGEILPNVLGWSEEIWKDQYNPE